MRKQEAIALIKSEQAKGVNNEEIIEILMSQDKIGNANPTRELIELLFTDEAPDDDSDQNEAKTMRKQECGVNDVYEKWEYSKATENQPSEPVKKLKTVRMSEQMADTLNRARSVTGFGNIIKYIKK